MCTNKVKYYLLTDKVYLYTCTMQNDADAGYVLLLLALTSIIDHWPCCHTRGLLVGQCFPAITMLKTKFACTSRCQQAECIQTYYWHHPTHLRELRCNVSCNHQCIASCQYGIHFNSFVRLFPREYFY